MLVYNEIGVSWWSSRNELIMLLMYVELNKIPLLHKLKQVYKCLPVFFFKLISHILLIAYSTSCIPRWRFISSIRNCNHVMKMLCGCFFFLLFVLVTYILSRSWGLILLHGGLELDSTTTAYATHAGSSGEAVMGDCTSLEWLAGGQGRSHL